MHLLEYRNQLNPYDQRLFDCMYNEFAKTAVRLLLEAAVDDSTIINTVVRYWVIPIDDIIEILTNEKIQMACESLEQYLRTLGYGSCEIKKFMLDNMVKIHLRNDHNLLIQRDKPDKIYKALQAKVKKNAKGK